MRKLILGLIVALAAVTTAEAKGCRLDGAMVKASVFDRIDVKPDPKFVGATFRVKRVASSLTTKPDTVGGLDTVTGGYIALRLSGRTGEYVVLNDYLPHSSPWSSASSKPAAEAEIRWAERSAKKEPIVLGRRPIFNVYGGPLEGITLRPLNCR